MDFSELLEGLKQNNEQAFDQFVIQYLPLIEYYITRKVSNGADRDDISQQILLKLFQKNLFARFKGQSEGEFRVYIGRISTNFVYDWLRSAITDKNRTSILDIETLSEDKSLYIDYGPLSQVLEGERQEKLDGLIALLPVKYQDVVNLRMMSYSNQEIAEILNRPKSTIETWFSRACERLRKILQENESESSLKEVLSDGN